MDDVLVDFSEKMYEHILLNWRTYSRYFWKSGRLSNEELMNRNIYSLNEWFIKSDYCNLDSGQYSALQLKIFALFIKEFFSTNIYENMKPNEFAKRTIMNPVYMNSPNVKKVIILSRNVTETQKVSKDKFIEKFFSHPKLEILYVDRYEGKGECLKRNNIEFDLFVDDEIPNIRNVAENFENLERKEFLIPEYGYNKMPIELRALIEEKGGIITYYNPFKK